MGNEKETEKNIINKTTQKGQSQSFLVGLGKKIMQGVKIVGEEVKFFLNPMHAGYSKHRIMHEVKQAFYRALGKPTEDYDPPTELEPNSECFGIKLTGEGGGYLGFKASDTLINSIAGISDEQIDKVNALNDENKNFNIVIDRVAKKIVIEIDVEEIINGITTDPDNKGKIEEEIKRLVIGKIIEEADSGLKELAGIVGGEFKKYADSQLLTGIGKKLYQSSEKKDESKSPAEENPTKPKKQSFGSSEIVSKPNVNKTEEMLHATNSQDTQQQKAQVEKAFSMTNPRDMLRSFEEFKATNVQNVSKASNHSPLLSPNVNDNERKSR
ncbi:hypothetical protein IC220_00735 [Wolbachia endosymbiont of Pentalonia nigronervosa]|jgi:hypothetical protein|uniref:hypothetical protein n=1 Tax=Wolbachia endosymbiont of Pentalonia nigronervosa TaxID=1301914 RepID=UPI00165F71D5|nr:hypothetical protein [Wolbachia endosymbiont of Pentalonia nigronervosa]MBD0390993.1 hypothetical protein [Wolbachia endosymbiont of Pentalonia nigronervosa]